MSEFNNINKYIILNGDDESKIKIIDVKKTDKYT